MMYLTTATRYFKYIIDGPELGKCTLNTLTHFYIVNLFVKYLHLERNIKK